MKKFFLLIPALVLSIVLNAATTPVSSGVNTLKSAVLDASSGDILELGDGIFYEEGNFDMNNSLTIKAAEGAHPVIANRYFFRVEGGADITFQGIKFDGSAWRNGNADPIGASDHCIRSHNNSTGEEDLQFIDCEFTGYPSFVIYTQRDTRRWNSITINNCTFYNNNRCVIRIDEDGGNHTKQSCNALTIENSTFAGVTTAEDVIYYNAPDAEHTTTLSVNHCTFYGHPKRAIYWQKSENLSVSNCVFSQPSSVSYKSVECIAGTISNSLSYNSAGYSSAATRTDNIVLDPLFVDPANNDFTLHNASPARRENGTVYGDPRWAKAIEPITIPATLQPIDAMLSDSAGVVLNEPNYINFKALGSHKFNDTEYAKWIITVDKKRIFSFTINANNPTEGTSHKYTIQVFAQNDEVNPILDQTTTSSSAAGDFQFKTNTISLNEGIYIVKVWNPTSWSVGNLVNVTASYEGGDIVAIPATLMPIDALRSEYAQLIHGDVDTLTFARLDHEWEADDADYTVDGSQYVKWNINIQKAGKYKFTANTYCTQGHNYRIILLSENEASTIGTWLEKDDISEYDFHTNVDYPVSTPVLDLTPGNYVFKMQAREKGRVMSVVATYEGGAVVNAPGEIQAVEAVIYDNGYKKMFHNANGDLEYGNSGTPSGEYAYWNINATEAGEMAVSFNSPSGGHNFLFELYEGTTLRGSVSEEGTDAIWEHNVTLANHLTIPAAGTYTLRVHNRTKWSSAILHSVTIEPYVAPAALEINEAAIDNSAWVANVGGAAANVKLIRTFKGGVYNSICVPFEAPMSKIKAAFGDDVELLYLEDANMSGDILNLVFANAPDFYQGTPYLIKPSADIVNPEFTNVNLLAEEAASTSHTGWPASFIGTFVKQEIAANPNNLYLGTDNKLYFSNNDVTIKGLRAYFNVNIPNPQQVIKHARIVTQGQVVTDVELVGAENQGILKTIENGQVIIIRDGIRYNVMGIQLQ